MELIVTERTFTTEVLESRLPVLVHFWAPWCGLCKVINPQLRKFQSQCGANVKLVGINADSNFKLANAYHLTSLPTLILFEDGQILHRQENFRSRDEVWQALEAMSLTCAKPRLRTREYQTHLV